MRVCHVVPDYFPGFATPYEYTRKLASLGVSVDVIALGRPGEPEEDFVDGVHVMRLAAASEVGGSPLRNLVRLIPATAKWLQGRHYDLVHVYAFRGCSLLPLLHARSSCRWLFNLRTGNVNSTGWRSTLADHTTRLESLPFDACIAIDKGVGRKVLGELRSFSVVPPGVDLAKFRPASGSAVKTDLGIDKKYLTVVFAGSLAPQRRPERILHAFQQALKIVPELRLLVIGSGTSYVRLTRLAEQLHIADKTRFTGFVPYEQIHEFITAADIGFAYVPMVPQYDLQPPLKTLEFLACGLPTLGTRTRGNAIFIAHGENGLLADDDPRALAEAIVRLARDENLRRKLAWNALASVEAYDWGRI